MIQTSRVELNRESQGLPCENESSIHRYRSRMGCTYEEALAQMGFQLDSFISGGGLRFLPPLRSW